MQSPKINYSKLNNDERLSLILDAIRNEDFEHYEKIIENVPNYTYKLTDQKLEHKINAAEKIGLIHLATMLELQCSFFAHYIQDRNYCKQNSGPYAEENIEALMNWDLVFDDTIDAMYTIDKAFKDFCDGINYTEEQLTAFLPTDFLNKPYWPRYFEHGQIDNSLYDKTLETYRTIWSE